MELTAQKIIKGGKALARSPEGKTVFIKGAIDGELVEVEVVESKKSFDEAECSKVLSASEHRVEPQCRHVEQGCGGCDWQHIESSYQSRLRKDIVVESLARIAKIDHAVEMGPSLPAFGYRTTLRCGVKNGRAALYASESDQLVSIPDCQIAHPLMQDILQQGLFGENEEVVIRVSETTGERLVIVEDVESVDVPEDVLVVEVDYPEGVVLTETVVNIDLQYGAESFFQPSRDAAERLVEVVGSMIDKDLEGPFLDAYCGVGLFSATLAENRRIIAVEASASSISDAYQNLVQTRDLEADAGQVQLIEGLLEDCELPKVGIAIADPPRSGLDKRGVRALVAAAPEQIILVSCDPASFARDAHLLVQEGYELGRVVALDNFAQTSHVEVVSSFTRI